LTADFRNSVFIRYHEFTKHTRAKVYGDSWYLDWDTQPDAFRRYEGAPTVALPVPKRPPPGDLFAPFPEAARGPVTLDAISQLLYHSVAISAWKEVPGTDARWAVRVNPSSGNLHPTETHLIACGVQDLEDGLYHFRVDTFELEVRFQGDVSGLVARIRDEIGFACGSATLFLTSIMWREAWKYRDRAFRYCHLDLGHAAAAVCDALRHLGHAPRAAHLFSDATMAGWIGLAGGDEVPEMLITWGEMLPGNANAPLPPPTELLGTPNALSSEVVDYESIDRVCEATSAVESTSQPEETSPTEPAASSLPLIAEGTARVELWRVVRTRRSGISFDGHTGCTAADLGLMLRRATDGYPFDCCSFRRRSDGSSSGAHFIDLYLYLHRVEGIEPGLYLYDRVHHALISQKIGDQRGHASTFSLDQAIAGDSAFAVSLIADLGRAFASFGERGYRAVHIEAGAIGQGLYLAAESLGLNSTGIGAFFDDEVNRHLALPESRQVVYHFTVGRALPDVRVRHCRSYPFEEDAMSATLAGRATPEATAAFARRHGDLGGDAYRRLGRTDLTVSRVGFGGYRVHFKVSQNTAALAAALEGGVNLIDTSSNYTDGGSELAAGTVLRELIDAGHLKREEVVVVTKAGYVQGKNHEIAAERERAGNPFPEMVKLGPDLWHCIHPDFLHDQITRSRERLGVETLDVFLLHNPEYFLEEAEQRRVPRAEAQAEYQRRIAEAFAHLEGEVRSGRIAQHGISSNTFPAANARYEHTSLEACWVGAEKLPAPHHFSVVQMPGNLMETGLALEKNQRGGSATALGVASACDLGVLINRPLNAFDGHQMLRLADHDVEAEPSADEIDRAIQEMRAHEDALRRIAPPRASGTRVHPGPAELMRVGEVLEGRWSDFRSREHWEEFVATRLVPQVQDALRRLEEFHTESSELGPWQERHVPLLNALIVRIRDHLAARDNRATQPLRDAMAPHLPDAVRLRPLSQIAVWALSSLPEVSCVLLGMRRAEYVRDALDSLKLEAPENRALWTALGVKSS
jgi:hypothetical protein